MTSNELNEILNKTRRTPNISLTPEQVEELVKDLERLEKQDEILHIFKNNMKLIDYKGNGSTQAYKILIEDRFTVEEDNYMTYRNLNFDVIKNWFLGKNKSK